MGRTPAARMPRAAARRRSGQVLSSVRPIAEQVAGVAGVVLWDLEFVREDGREVLRVSVDTASGVEIDAISTFAQELSARLDDLDAVPGETRYWLEVGSPGADRRLRSRYQFDLCVGRFVRVTFKGPRDVLEGTLTGVGDDGVSVDDELIAYEDISQVRLNGV